MDDEDRGVKEIARERRERDELFATSVAAARG